MIASMTDTWGHDYEAIEVSPDQLRDYADLCTEAAGQFSPGGFLSDMADEMDKSYLDHVNSIATYIGLLASTVGVGMVAAAALSSVIGWIVAIVGLLAGLVSFTISAWNNLSAFYEQALIMAGSKYGGMGSDLPNYGPEWAAAQG